MADSDDKKIKLRLRSFRSRERARSLDVMSGRGNSSQGKKSKDQQFTTGLRRSGRKRKAVWTHVSFSTPSYSKRLTHGRNLRSHTHSMLRSNPEPSGTSEKPRSPLKGPSKTRYEMISSEEESEGEDDESMDEFAPSKLMAQRRPMREGLRSRAPSRGVRKEESFENGRGSRKDKKDLKVESGRRRTKEVTDSDSLSEGESMAEEEEGEEEEDEDEEDEDEEEGDEEEEEHRDVDAVRQADSHGDLAGNGGEKEELGGGHGREEEAAAGDEDRATGRRYSLRSRTVTQQKQTTAPAAKTRSPFRNGRRKSGRGKLRSHHREESDDSLLLDDMDEGPRRRTAGDMSWLGTGVEFLAPSSWGLAGPSGWASQSPWQAGGRESTAGIQNQPMGKPGLAGKVGADIQPVQVDTSVDFSQVGGLSEYVNSLKEMVFFPLLYPQFFSKYHIAPPRGVLLCGPPGTGKTLVARALASSASRSGRKVSFFMRKGADVLSKWVGEAERQLRLLFEEAARCQPSIIFFDEIDGLAPVRSSKQEQIHNSIVSTLLALMDGLDSRGQVVVIGATNRVDAIDGALRRPGRFDREFFFKLPDMGARNEILDIHTRRWKDPPSEAERQDLAQATVGFCGADLKALCAEAAIRAFRKTYPQVYASDEQLQIDVDEIRVGREHFREAMAEMTPAGQRSAVVHSRPLPEFIRPMLERHVDGVAEMIGRLFPPLWDVETAGVEEDEMEVDYGASVVPTLAGIPFLQQPRVLICGKEGFGQSYVGPAVLHRMERFPVYSLSLPALLADPSAKTPEEALVHIFGEARKNSPSVLYLPHLSLWWDTSHDQLRATLQMLLADFPPSIPVLLLGTAEELPADVDPDAKSMFSNHIYTLDGPSTEERRAFFQPVLEAAMAVPRFRPREAPAKPPPPVLPKASPVPAPPSEEELKIRAEEEEHSLRRLRMCFRDVCNRLLHEKRFAVFHLPVDPEEEPEYVDVVSKPMDVATLLQNVDKGRYRSRTHFLRDVDLIPANAKAYCGNDYQGARIVSKALALKDAVHGMLAQMDPALVATCDEIEARYGQPPEEEPDPEPLIPTPTPAPAPAAAAAAAAARSPVEVAADVTPQVLTRATARSRGMQPLVDMSQVPPDVKRKRAPSDEVLSGNKALRHSISKDRTSQEVAMDVSTDVEVNHSREALAENDGAVEAGSTHGCHLEAINSAESVPVTKTRIHLDLNTAASEEGTAGHGCHDGDGKEQGKVCERSPPLQQLAPPLEDEVSEETKLALAARSSEILGILLEKCQGMCLSELAAVNASLWQGIHQHRRLKDRMRVLDYIHCLVRDLSSAGP